MGFFICDLHRHIEKLHKEQFGDHRTGKTFTVYRGQGLSKNDFDKLKKSKGGLMSFNNFLSTSKTRDVALEFAGKTRSNPDLTGILFVMTIDPSKSTAPLASIGSVSYYKTEEEVLFSMHTVFRINDIISMSDDHRLIQVNLTLTTDDDKDLHRLTECIREETFPDAVGWDRLGNLLLLKMGQPKQAQQVYEVMLEQATDEIEKGLLYQRLGLAKDNQGEFDEAIKYYEKSLNIYKKRRPDDPDLAITYNNVGKLYYDKQEYMKALYAHQKALDIRQQSLPTDDPGLAMSYNNIGAVCEVLNDYPKALSSYEKALEIQKQSLVWNHPDISASYNNIGTVYHQMNKNPQAILYFKKCIEIKEQSLPPNHPSLGMSYNHMGMAYESMGEFSKAYSCFERAVNIGQQSNHHHLQGYRKNLDRIKKRLN
jgi:tetratricopeptide (TPR) repeat protein